jgi:hypothetical protein
VLAGLRATWRERDPAGLLRAGAIVAGLLSAGAGYAAVQLRRRP